MVGRLVVGLVALLLVVLAGAPDLAFAAKPTSTPRSQARSPSTSAPPELVGSHDDPASAAVPSGDLSAEGSSAEVGSYTNSAIADKALTYWSGSNASGHRAAGARACQDAQKPGDSGGQCRAFVNCVVWMVSEHAQNLGGSDYFQSFLNAGGTRITDVNALAKGDIVQYGQGGHTTIIVGRVSPGQFMVVDSNHWSNDETVGYYQRAITLSNEVRAYRMGTTPAPYQPATVDPRWVAQGGYATDVAMARITGGWEMFHIGRNNVIYRKKLQNGVTTAWSAISGPRAKRIATATSGDGRVELFYIGMNNAIYHHWESSPGGDISRWESLGGVASEIAAARSGNNWEVFHIGTDRAIYRATQANHTWQRLPGTIALGLAAATSRDGRVELFHIATGRNVMHAWQTAPGSGFVGTGGANTWQDLGGVTYAIGASSVGNGEYEIYAVGNSNRLYRQAPWSQTNGWQRLVGSGSRITAAMNPDGRVEVLHIGTGNAMYHAWEKRVGWF